MRDRGLLSAVLAFVVLAAACDSDPGEKPERPEPVVVYASYADENYWPAMFAGFTEETGIPVTLRNGEPAQLTSDVIANRGSPPADVLLTRNVADVWRAADEGGLRPIAAAGISHIPDFLRDPDGLWAAMSLRAAVILHNFEVIDEKPVAYADLADPRYRGQLCLSSSALAVNRSLIASMISELGVRPAEILVRGWVRNLAQPPFQTEAALFAAVDAGSCRYGILSSQVAVSTTSASGDGNAEFITPQPAYFDIEGLGIARHARNASGAEVLLDWMLSQEAQELHALGAYQYPARSGNLREEIAARISRRNVGLAGWHDNDAQLLAERAGYR